jgi:hypothetical protein
MRNLRYQKRNVHNYFILESEDFPETGQNNKMQAPEKRQTKRKTRIFEPPYAGCYESGVPRGKAGVAKRLIDLVTFQLGLE